MDAILALVEARRWSNTRLGNLLIELLSFWFKAHPLDFQVNFTKGSFSPDLDSLDFLQAFRSKANRFIVGAFFGMLTGGRAPVITELTEWDSDHLEFIIVCLRN